MNRRAMLIPKPSRRRRFIPALPDYELDHLIGKLAPPERKALAQICETADLLTVDERPWLLLPADPRLLDTLAVFGAEAEDRENDLEAAKQGNVEAQHNLGLMYSKGRGVPQDYVQAHMWYSLAASRFSPRTDRAKAVRNRDILAAMMTPAQIAKAQRLAREWKPKKERK